VRYDLDPEAERKDSPPPAHAPEQPAGDREQLASAVGNSAIARVAQAGNHAPRGLVSGAPMSLARKAATDELEEAPGAAEATGGEHAEGAPAGGEAPAPAAEAAAPEAAQAPAPAAEAAAPEAAQAPAPAEHEAAGELEEDEH
jgi:hypothetical protein